MNQIDRNVYGTGIDTDIGISSTVRLHKSVISNDVWQKYCTHYIAVMIKRWWEENVFTLFSLSVSDRAQKIQRLIIWGHDEHRKKIIWKVSMKKIETGGPPKKLIEQMKIFTTPPDG